MKNDQYLVISMQVLTNNARSYQFAVNGSTPKENFEYWICDNQWNVTYASGSKVSVPSVKLTNSTFTQITATGFDGMIVLPVSAFGDIEKIESVSIFADLSNLYARFNLYSVALTDAEGFASDGSPQILPEEIIWTAGEENFEFYGNEPDAAKLRYLEKGEVVLEKIMHANGRDALWWTVPEELLDEDGYINSRIQTANVSTEFSYSPEKFFSAPDGEQNILTKNTTSLRVGLPCPKIMICLIIKS